MIIEYIRYRVLRNAHARLPDAYAQASRALDALEHCLGYELPRCEEEPDHFAPKILLTSTHDDLRPFPSSSQFREFLSHVKRFLSNIEEMPHYHLTKVTSNK